MYLLHQSLAATFIANAGASAVRESCQAHSRIDECGLTLSIAFSDNVTAFDVLSMHRVPHTLRQWKEVAEQRKVWKMQWFGVVRRKQQFMDFSSVKACALQNPFLRIDILWGVAHNGKLLAKVQIEASVMYAVSRCGQFLLTWCSRDHSALQICVIGVFNRVHLEKLVRAGVPIPAHGHSAWYISDLVHVEAPVCAKT